MQMQIIKRPGRYAALAAGYYDDPAVIAAGPDAELIYIRMISWCAMHPETDGIIPLEVAKNRLGFTDALTRIEALEANSLVTVDDTTITITSWIRWNGSWSEIKAADNARKASARERKARQRARQAAAKTNPDTATPAPEETPPPPPRHTQHLRHPHPHPRAPRRRSSLRPHGQQRRHTHRPPPPHHQTLARRRQAHDRPRPATHRPNSRSD